jgi:hypothetical protein
MVGFLYPGRRRPARSAAGRHRCRRGSGSELSDGGDQILGSRISLETGIDRGLLRAERLVVPSASDACPTVASPAVHISNASTLALTVTINGAFPKWTELSSYRRETVIGNARDIVHGHTRNRQKSAVGDAD